jgi:hypothetical protein
MAERLIRWVGLQLPIDVDRAARLLGIDVEELYMPGPVAGLLAKEAPGRWLIVVNSRYGEEERRFTVAHELGHWTLHRRFLQDSSQEIRDHLQEQEANRFAYALLLPPEEVEECFRHGSGVNLARRFGVSRAAAANAVRRLGFDLWRIY